MSTFSFQHEHQLWVENMNAKAVKKNLFEGKWARHFGGGGTLCLAGCQVSWRTQEGLSTPCHWIGQHVWTDEVKRGTFALGWQAEAEGVDVCCLTSPRAMRERSGIWTTKKYELLACRRVSFTGDTLKIANKHVQKWLNVVKWGVRQLRTM